MFYLDDERWYRYDYAAPILAIPRLPYDVLFAIGGWNNGIQISTMETYDNRARLWTSAIESVDRNEHRIYHDATVINHKIFCIGGLGPDEPRNSCKVFDALTKTWSEVCDKIIITYLTFVRQMLIFPSCLNGSNVFFR